MGLYAAALKRRSSTVVRTFVRARPTRRRDAKIQRLKADVSRDIDSTHKCSALIRSRSATNLPKTIPLENKSPEKQIFRKANLPNAYLSEGNAGRDKSPRSRIGRRLLVWFVVLAAEFADDGGDVVFLEEADGGDASCAGFEAGFGILQGHSSEGENGDLSAAGLAEGFEALGIGSGFFEDWGEDYEGGLV